MSLKFAGLLAREVPDLCKHEQWEGHEGDSSCKQCHADDMELHQIYFQREAFIKQIQLNAMREGYRRAAEIAQRRAYKQCGNDNEMHAFNGGIASAQEEIIIAAEQLTEKDLEV